MTQPALHRLKSRQLYRRLLVVMALASHVTVAVNQVLPSVNLPARLGSGALAAAFITFVLLALSTGFYRWWTDRDEREKAVLAGAHFLVYHYAMGLFVIALTWYFMAADRSGLWLPRTGMEINQLLLWIFYLLFLAPLAIVGWTEPDPPAE